MTTNGKERTHSTRRFSRGRITGLTLIAVLTLGLGYLHFAGSSTAVSVPAGAHAGQLTLKNCTYNTEKGAYAADCGTLVVPENRADPHSRLIALPVIRDPCAFGTPGRPDLPPARRPRRHEHVVRRRQSVHRQPRRRPRRLPRRRRLRPARLPGSRVGPRGTPPTSSARSPSMPTRTRSARARSGSRQTASISPATHSPNGSTTSRRHGKPSATTRSTC